MQELYHQIGHLEVELDWFKKMQTYLLKGNCCSLIERIRRYLLGGRRSFWESLKKRLQRLIGQIGLETIHPKPCLSKSNLIIRYLPIC